jgi:hypothetical protein
VFGNAGWCPNLSNGVIKLGEVMKPSCIHEKRSISDHEVRCEFIRTRENKIAQHTFMGALAALAGGEM